MVNLYNNAIKSIDKIEDRYLTTPLVEILNGHKEDADYEFDVREDEFLDHFIVVREWWVDFLEQQLSSFEVHVVEQAGECDDKITKEKELLVQKTTQMKEEMSDFFASENTKFQEFVDECINRFKWLLRKYGMDAKLPAEDTLNKASPDPFTGALNDEDAAKHEAQHDNWESHVHGDGRGEKDPTIADPLSNLSGKPKIPKGQGIKPGPLVDPEESDHGHVPAHEHSTPIHPQGPKHAEVDSDIDSEEVEREVNEVLHSKDAADDGYGISDAELKKKIEATVEFFLGKLPSRASELITGLTTRRSELSEIINHVRGGLTSALTTEFEQAWSACEGFLA